MNKKAGVGLVLGIIFIVLIIGGTSYVLLLKGESDTTGKYNTCSSVCTSEDYDTGYDKETSCATGQTEIKYNSKEKGELNCCCKGSGGGSGGGDSDGPVDSGGKECNSKINIPNNPTSEEFYDVIVDYQKGAKHKVTFDIKGSKMKSMIMYHQYPLIKLDLVVEDAKIETYLNSDTGESCSCAFGTCTFTKSEITNRDKDITSSSLSLTLGEMSYESETTMTSTYSGTKKIGGYKTYCFTSLPNEIVTKSKIDVSSGWIKSYGTTEDGKSTFTVCSGSMCQIYESEVVSTSTACVCNNGVMLYMETKNPEGTTIMTATDIDLDMGSNAFNIEMPTADSNSGEGGPDSSACDILPEEERAQCIEAYAAM